MALSLSGLYALDVSGYWCLFSKLTEDTHLGQKLRL